MAFPTQLPTFNLYSFAVVENSQEKLMPRQKAALEEVTRFFSANPVGNIALIGMPTGSGKTGVISCLPYFLGQTGLVKPPPGCFPTGQPRHLFDRPVLVIAPDLAIADQLEEELLIVPETKRRNFLVKRGIVPEDFACALPHGKKILKRAHVPNELYLKQQHIVISNAQKFGQKPGENPDQNPDQTNCSWRDLPDDIFHLVIVDEAHHYPATTWREIVSKFRNHAMVVFLTATPYRGDGKRVLEDKVTMVYRLSLEDARKDGIIRRTKWHPISSGHSSPADVWPLILEKMKKIQDHKDKATPLPDKIPHMAIAIAYDVSNAKKIAEIAKRIWGNPGHIMAYHSQLKRREKEEMKEKIEKNAIRLLVVVAMLLEGFDHPPISVAGIMTKIVSPVKFTQFIGRAQRVVRGQSEKESRDIFADIVTHDIFEQEDNYEAFKEEKLIEDNDTVS